MKGPVLDGVEIPIRNELKSPFFQIGNEVLDVFLPIMGADCLAVYSFFAHRVHFDPRLIHNVTGLADSLGLSRSVVSRSLEILEYLRLVNLTRFRGSRKSECRLLDSWVVAERFGATYDSTTHLYRLPPQVAMRLEAEVKAIRDRQQGKKPGIASRDAIQPRGNRPISVSQRNASVSPERRQRATRETQTGTHLLREERRNGNIPTPTPSRDCEAQKAKDSPDEDEPDELLKRARSAFIGVVDDLRAHLLDTSRPQVPHLANGAADWETFGLNNLAVESASWRGKVLVLVLSASDPTAAGRGLYKYRKTWKASLRRWFECEVHVGLRRAQRKW